VPGQERLVEEIVVVVEEGRLPAVAALGDMMRQARRDDAGKTRQARPPISPADRRRLGIVFLELPRT
jgi:hypothetical protein